LANKYRYGDSQNQAQATPSSQSVGRTDCHQKGSVLASDVKESQVQQVEGISSEEVPHGQVRRVNYDYRAHSVEKFRQRGNQGQEDESYPDSAEAGFFGDNISISGYLSPREKNNQNAKNKLNPYQSAFPLLK